MDAGASRRGGRRGFSLMEVAVVLAIVALLVAATMLYFQDASTANKAKETLEEMVSIRAAAQQLYGGTGFVDSPGDSNATAVIARSRILPAKWVSGDAIKDPFGGDVIVEVGGYGAFITINVTNLAGSACTALGAQDFGPDITDVDINYVNHPAPNAHVSPGDVTRLCNTGNDNLIVWNFAD